jgi:hypothetical protein
VVVKGWRMMDVELKMGIYRINVEHRFRTVMTAKARCAQWRLMNEHEFIDLKTNSTLGR